MAVEGPDMRVRGAYLAFVPIRHLGPMRRAEFDSIPCVTIKKEPTKRAGKVPSRPDLKECGPRQESKDDDSSDQRPASMGARADRRRPFHGLSIPYRARGRPRGAHVRRLRLRDQEGPRIQQLGVSGEGGLWAAGLAVRPGTGLRGGPPGLALPDGHDGRLDATLARRCA